MGEALDQLTKEAEDTEQKALEAAGVNEQYNLWRESMPEERLPNEAALDTFLHLTEVESAAQEGRLSVVTGGEPLTPDTDVPTPGPDDEGAGPDEAGDTSQGGEGESTDLKIVEGMWQPPPEAEAENYVEPTTKEMIATPEWVEAAEAYYKFKGEPMLWGDTPAEWAKAQMSAFNWNLMFTMDHGKSIMSGEDPKAALAFLNLINMYDHSDGGAVEFGNALIGMATDPTTYFGLGVGGIAARGAAKATAKAGLKKMITFALVGGSGGITEGTLLGGGFDLVKQNVEQEAGARQDIDYGRAGKAAAAGGALGLLLGGGGGHLAGRYADKLTAGAEKEMARQMGGSNVLERRSVDDMTPEQFKQALAAISRVDDDFGTQNTAAEMALKLLNGDEGLPTKENGKIDFDEVVKILGEADERNVSGSLPERVPLTESEKLAQRILEMDELQAGGIVTKTASRPGSLIARHGTPGAFELVGHTKNGWYRAISKRTGEEVNLRRKDFDILDAAPPPETAGPMSLDPFGPEAAKIMAMTEELSSSKLREVNISYAEQEAIVKDLQNLGVKITQKNMATHWTPAEMLFLRNTYNSQANGMADMVRKMSAALKRGDVVMDSDLARFNDAHTQFVTTRDLFFGVSGNAARTLNILRLRPKEEVYQFSQSLLDSINMTGGRVATERAINLMADFVIKGDGNVVKGISKISDNIWGNRWAAALLNTRYNFMLSSWRTHFFNFLGNSASGVYHHLMVSPVAGVINNITHASQLAFSKIPGVPKNLRPDPAERFTLKVWGAEVMAHKQSAMDSLRLAKEIAMGRDIGEGKVWNELGLRYDVINVPNSSFGKLGTTPVRLLEAGDAFFKNQYYNSKMHAQAARKARFEEVHNNMNFDERHQWWMDNPDSTMEKQATEFAAKMTYTNDPNVYGGVFAVLAKGMQTMQSRSLAFNMLVPFVRTPANLLSFSMEMTGLNTLVSAPTTYRQIMSGSPLERQEALARLTVAVGLWYTVSELHKEGLISGAGPTSWEEVEAWKAAGWQPNSVKLGDVWVDMSRAQPAGRALNLMATVFDYAALNPSADADSTIAWLGQGLLYTADDIVDESYMSTVSDFITAVQAKEEGRIRSVGASMVNSVLVPNLIRDLRRPADKTMRSSSSTDSLSQVVKQMKNAMPGLSDNIAPQRDWKGDPKDYYGNAYTRALIPFTMRDSTDTDPASMAIAYARIGPSVPDKRIAMPGGAGNFIDLFVMDNGDGFVYDKYVEFVGKSRHEAVNIAMKDPRWKALVKEGNIGPGSEGDTILRKAIAIGSNLGRQEMLRFLIDHHGDNSMFKRQNGDTVMIHHTVSIAQYADTIIKLRQENIPVPDDLPQYDLRERREGPEFFKP